MTTAGYASMQADVFRRGTAAPGPSMSLPREDEFASMYTTSRSGSGAVTGPPQQPQDPRWTSPPRLQQQQQPQQHDGYVAQAMGIGPRDASGARDGARNAQRASSSGQAHSFGHPDGAHDPFSGVNVSGGAARYRDPATAATPAPAAGPSPRTTASPRFAAGSSSSAAGPTTADILRAEFATPRGKTGYAAVGDAAGNQASPTWLSGASNERPARSAAASSDATRVGQAMSYESSRESEHTVDRASSPRRGRGDGGRDAPAAYRSNPNSAAPREHEPSLPDSYGRSAYVVPSGRPSGPSPASPATRTTNSGPRAHTSSASASRVTAAERSRVVARNATTLNRRPRSPRVSKPHDGTFGPVESLPSPRPKIDSATYELKDGLHRVTGRMHELTSRLHELSHTHSDLQLEAERLRREIQEAEHERTAVRGQFEALVASLRESMQQLTDEVSAKAEQVRRAKAENEELRRHTAILRDRPGAAPELQVAPVGGWWQQERDRRQQPPQQAGGPMMEFLADDRDARSRPVQLGAGAGSQRFGPHQQQQSSRGSAYTTGGGFSDGRWR